MSVDLKDWLNSINVTKQNIIDEDPSCEKDYPPYIINKCLAGNLDCIFFANQMNLSPGLDNKLQYDFYINSLRKRKRFSPWLKKEKFEHLEAVKEFYGFSSQKAEQALRILSEEQIKYIYGKIKKGGIAP